MLPIEMTALTWRPRERNGTLGEPVTFEIEKTEADRLDGLSKRIQELSAGEVRTALISELAFFLDTYAVFPGTTVVEKPKAFTTEVIAEVEKAETNGFKIPGQVKEQLSLGQLSLTDPGSAKLEPLPSILDAQAAIEQREKAIDRVTEAADPGWILQASAVFREVALRRQEMTTDPVWEILARRGVDPPPERRAMAAVVRAAQAEGMIERTDRFVPSALPWAHRRNTRVWKSLVYQGEAKAG